MTVAYQAWTIVVILGLTIAAVVGYQNPATLHAAVIEQTRLTDRSHEVDVRLLKRNWRAASSLLYCCAQLGSLLTAMSCKQGCMSHLMQVLRHLLSWLVSKQC